VEEQFYILWPGIFVALSMAGDQGLLRLLRLLAIPVLLAPVCRGMGHKVYPPILGPAFQGYSFFSYFDSLAIGCAGAIILSRKREIVEAWSKARPRFVFAVGLGLVVVTHIAYKLSPHMALLRAGTVLFGPSAQAFGLLVLVLQSIVSPQWRTYRVLNWWWVRRIGVLSYSLYIWQQIFCSKPETFGWRHFWWISFPGWVVSALAVAFLSYYGFERPFLKLRARLHDS
jgi:peptidoglycan/LPS O-acetylase OafA/YrhL